MHKAGIVDFFLFSTKEIEGVGQLVVPLGITKAIFVRLTKAGMKKRK